MPENLQKQHLTNPNRNLKVKMFYIDRKLFVTFFFYLLLEFCQDLFVSSTKGKGQLSATFHYLCANRYAHL